MSTKPFFLTYVKQETDVRKKNQRSGHGLFPNRPADTVRSLPSDRRLTLADNTRQKRRTRTNRLSGHGLLYRGKSIAEYSMSKESQSRISLWPRYIKIYDNIFTSVFTFVS